MARPPVCLYKVDSTSGCHVWQGVCSWNGYPRIKRDNRLQWAHRWFYSQVYGDIPDGMDLDHLCRDIKCVNPDHLEIVTKAENQRRGLAVRLTWEAVDDIRQNCIPFDPEFGQRAMARKYGVTHAAIQKVLNDESWIDKESVPA